MANFTRAIKLELIAKQLKTKKQKKAALSAFFRANGELTYDFFTHEYGAEFVTETEEVAEFFFSVLETVYLVEPITSFREDRLSKKEKFRFSFKGDRAKEILKDLKILSEKDDLIFDISEELFSTPEERLAYVQGAFLGSGSCTLPKNNAKTGFHLQFSFRSGEIASDFSTLLAGEELLFKTIEHKGNFVVYIGSKEGISDFLSVVGATNCLNELSALVEKRENANNENRVQNCETANKDKTLSASKKQVEAIEKLYSSPLWEKLDVELKEIALLRLSKQEYSLSQLASELTISKSAASRRMNKIISLSEETL